MFDLVAETSSSEDESNERLPRRLKAWQEDNSKHPRVWFDRELANELWMLAAATDLHAHPRPSICAPPHSESVVAAMLTSWFEVSNFVDAPRTPWRDLAPGEPRQLSDRCSDGALTSERTEPPDKTVNSAIKLRLHPDRHQRAKLDHMFASNKMHHNYCLVDGALLLYGSINWSSAALDGNQEFLVIRPLPTAFGDVFDDEYVRLFLQNNVLIP